MVTTNLDPASFDRTDFFPPHEGENVLPHDLLFHRLYFLALNQNTTAVRDSHNNHEISYHQLFSDVVAARNLIRQQLTANSMEMIRRGDEICVLVVARGYEFVVAFFAVMCLGAIVVPQSPHISFEELIHAAKTSRAHATVCSARHEDLCRSITGSPGIENDYRVVLVDSCIKTTPIDLGSLVFSSGKAPDPNKPGLIIFTSGSTGRPKGAAMRRYNVIAIALAAGWRNNIGPGFTSLQSLPTHHATGLMVNTVPTLVGGGCVEFTSAKLDIPGLWDRIRRGNITLFSAVPTVFIRLLQHWDNVLMKLDVEEREEYRRALCSIDQLHCGSAALPVHVSRKWATLCDGRHILERYGGTEFGNPFSNLKGMTFVPGSVGIKNPGTESYLEGGDQGEVHVRSPFMFSKYINDIEGTKKALTDDGFFKTGDIAERVGDLYFLKGRSSVDIIKSGGYKISAIDIEREILEHPKVQEVIVVGVDDAELGQRIATAVVLKEGQQSLSLPDLRDFLKDRLSYYKLPTVLRVVPELKKTNTFKVPKLLLKKELFETGHPDLQYWKRDKAKL
ncbi:hypothetical protein Z517_06052 [Fonsecaea pedrosoi CBS 271.37]|uniref:AMP-dependent synthetase/ligase domain-containing protein n=1 Tax=Fonsecaea pedrosoi CBS 271.37 TaxID=1442368 RepID=A0A0D2GLS9_9EURO|nr:uncharacterized protein Z517_06052 [Fonsecaea pedrosoi CBS 271.37]KIW79440.1 hypothetical protein Z517_06052 [Fonsecaea pedrosoi CBS 271.37]